MSASHAPTGTPATTNAVATTPVTAPATSAAIMIDTAREVIRLSELYLDGTIKLALAADARAMQIAGLSSTAATALAIFGLNYVTESGSFDFSLSIAAFFAALPFYVAVILALWSASPKDFYISGNLVSRWDDAELTGNLADALMSQARNYNRQGISNSNSLTISGRRIQWALRSIAFAPVAASVGGVGTYFRSNLLDVVLYGYAAARGLIGV